MDELTLDTKYSATSGRVFVSGVQALARLPLMQRMRDAAAGLNTAGYISGYRGSPLGGYDEALWSAQKFLDAGRITFNPGVNEDMAATACWGTQQAGLFGQATYDGVFAIWYGKGPGVDRSGDPLKHGNLAGTSPLGGVLVMTGDDHLAKSSTTAHQSEQALIAAMIPILYPASVQEFLDFGLHGFALSRYSGAYAGFKCVGDIVEGSASVAVDADRVHIITPDDFEIPEDGLHIRWPDPMLDQESRLINLKLKAAQAYLRANRLDRETHAAPTKRLGIVAAGKAWLDVCQAFDELGLSDRARRDLGISVFKPAMVWPLEPQRISAWAAGLDEVLVIEEKRAIIEDQLARLLYGLDQNIRPRLIGKLDEAGRPLVPEAGGLSGAEVARIIANRFLEADGENCLASAAAALAARTKQSNLPAAPAGRVSWFCAGCPHNSSTKVPKGSIALLGIGCHTMSMGMDRDTGAFTHMGGEGGAWIGMAPFSETAHVFQNMGDGTYFHSGLLAIRAAIAAGVNITYKILFNDAVALTGGQPVEGGLRVWDISRQLAAEGAGRIAVISDEPDKYPAATDWAAGVEIHHRRGLDTVQREFRTEPGVTAIIYDQTCAAEKRRRRKRGLIEDPDRRLFINQAVCDGCGDCNAASNCVAVWPIDTELGRKRRIDQSSCNKDFSCLDGFCPSFVTVEGASPRQVAPPGAGTGDPAADLPEPRMAEIAGVYNIVLCGIGGTGVVTAGALLGTAAHLDGLGCSVLDQTGLAQKNGAVTSHLRVAADPAAVLGTRIGTGMADLVLGFDMVVAAGAEAVLTLSGMRSRAVINDHLVPLALFAAQPDLPFAAEGYAEVIKSALGTARLDLIDTTRLASELLGDSIAGNILLIGFAYQKGLLPLSAQSIRRAIELNGVAIAANLQAFAWGRVAAAEPRRIQALIGAEAADETSGDLDDFIAARTEDLAAYRNPALGARYAATVQRIREAEARLGAGGAEELTRAVAEALYKLIAIKDEYEVARAYTDGHFRAALAAQFSGDYRLRYHLSVPWITPRDPLTGDRRKMELGAWIEPFLKLLAGMKVLRGTVFDPFGYQRERRAERGLLAEFEGLIDEMAVGLTAGNYEAAVALARLPLSIRGFGHVKRRAMVEAKVERVRLLARWRGEESENNEKQDLAMNL